MAVRLLWCDSVGAKSMAIYVDTPDVHLLVDPGASGMQPSFPLEEEERDAFKLAAFDTIRAWAKAADVVVVTHYHHDHYADPAEFPDIYDGKLLLVKDPNQWINRSQWHRARDFFEGLAKQYGDPASEPLTSEPRDLSQHDPAREHPHAFGKDFGDYNRRRKQILDKGQRRLESLRQLWTEEPWLSPQEFGTVRVEFADEREFRFGQTRVRFTRPLFHGIEFATVGWIVALVVEHGAHKLVFTSDLQGPTIEDYVDWLVQEQPDLLILDGPPTYLFGQLVNRINMQRAIENALRIAEQLPRTLIIYDHHLPRDPRFRERMHPLYEILQNLDRAPFLTMAEWCNLQPLVEELTHAEVR